MTDISTKQCACGSYHELTHPHFGTMYTAAGNDPGVRVLVLLDQNSKLRAENERLRKNDELAHVTSAAQNNAILKLSAEVERWKNLVKTFSAGNVALEAEIERLTRINNQAIERMRIAESHTVAEQERRIDAEAATERLRAALTLGQVMLDSLNDENEFNPDTVHAFAVALGDMSTKVFKS